MTRWQPIETAPLDGTSILWCSVEEQQHVIHWDTYRECFAEKGSHWMPLPHPPGSTPPQALHDAGWRDAVVERLENLKSQAVYENPFHEGKRRVWNNAVETAIAIIKETPIEGKRDE